MNASIEGELGEREPIFQTLWCLYGFPVQLIKLLMSRVQPLVQGVCTKQTYRGIPLSVLNTLPSGSSRSFTLLTGSFRVKLLGIEPVTF